MDSERLVGKMIGWAIGAFIASYFIRKRKLKKEAEAAKVNTESNLTEETLEEKKAS